MFLIELVKFVIAGFFVAALAVLFYISTKEGGNDE